MKSTMRILVAALLLFIHTAYAKEIAVLLPITGALTPHEKLELTKDTVDGLSPNFELKHGEEVDRVVKMAFQEENKKQDCDETNCYRRIASKYDAEKIIALRVTTMVAGHYLVTLQIYDVPTGEMTFSQKNECKTCSFEILKGLCKELTSQVLQKK